MENKVTDLIKIKNFIDYDKKVQKNDKKFEKLMFIYKMATKELETKIEIIKDEFKLFYDYDLIDHINTRIKTPNSIMKKMKDKELECTYKDMVENINDIAGIRVICPLKKDIFSVKNMIQKLPGVKTIKEKDYITNPKKSGYSAYHLVLGIPVVLSQSIIYVKVEVQIRTMAMDFWSSLEHKMKYKTNHEITKKISKEWIAYAKMVNKIDNKIMNME
jgi:putative GTP pyrophosphokinase